MIFALPDYLHERASEAIASALVSIEEIREAVLSKIRELSLPDAKERRRYALLQSATAFMAMDGRMGSDDTARQAIDWAEMALAEIERRNP